MPDEYRLAHDRKLRDAIRERARLRAITGLSSTRAWSTVHGLNQPRSLWRRLIDYWKGNYGPA